MSKQAIIAFVESEYALRIAILFVFLAEGNTQARGQYVARKVGGGSARHSN